MLNTLLYDSIPIVSSLKASGMSNFKKDILLFSRTECFIQKRKVKEMYFLLKDVNRHLRQSVFFVQSI